MKFPIYIKANNAPVWAEVLSERESICITMDKESTAVVKVSEENTCGALQMLIDTQATQITKQQYLEKLTESKILIYG